MCIVEMYRITPPCAAHSFPFQSIRCHGMLLFNPKQIPQIKNKYHPHTRAAVHPTTVTSCSICTLSSIRSVTRSRCHKSIPSQLHCIYPSSYAWREINPLFTTGTWCCVCPTSVCQVCCCQVTKYWACHDCCYCLRGWMWSGEISFKWKLHCSVILKLYTSTQTPILICYINLWKWSACKYF